MMPVMSRPPEGALLRGRITNHCEKELKPARGPESSVRKIAMIETCDSKHANKVKSGSDQNGGPAPTHPNDAETHDMNADKSGSPCVVRPCFLNERFQTFFHLYLPTFH
jgi:hypothetical protein